MYTIGSMDVIKHLLKTRGVFGGFYVGYFGTHFLSAVCSLLPAARCLLPAVYCVLPAVYCLLPAACCLLPAGCWVRATVYFPVSTTTHHCLHRHAIAPVSVDGGLFSRSRLH
jgi:hypothetical protein